MEAQQISVKKRTLEGSSASRRMRHAGLLPVWLFMVRYKTVGGGTRNARYGAGVASSCLRNYFGGY